VYRVIIEGLAVQCRIGVTDVERASPREIVLDLDLEVEGAATQTDDVADTVDYSELSRLVEGSLVESPYRTLERLADEVCRLVLREFPSAQAVTVRASKGRPPMESSLDWAAVEISLRRE
jgi:dihydroneopterin aldolase